MKKDFTPKKAVLIGLGAALVYKFIKGDGIFNKPRFYSQYKAVERYLSTYHSGARAGNISTTESGWHCIVTTPEKSFLLNIHRTQDGMYLFSETDL